MHNRKIAHFQGQIETALKKFREELDLRTKDLFAKLRIKSHLTAAGIRKWEGYSLLAYLLEHGEQSQTIGDLFRQQEEETVKSLF